jgi:excisionase family DNA binding protein
MGIKPIGAARVTSKDVWMTVTEVAEELKLPPSRVYRLIRNCGDPLPAHRVGERTIRVQRDELQAWLDDRKIVSREDANMT